MMRLGTALPVMRRATFTLGSKSSYPSRAISSLVTRQSMPLAAQLSKSKTVTRTMSSLAVRQGVSFNYRSFANAQSMPLAVHLGSIQHLSSWPGGNNPKGSGRLGAGLGIVSAGALLLGKGKYLLGALKLTKFASLGSMFVTIGTYSMFFGLPYAAGMVGLITVHEAGHALAMRYRGIPFSPMIFVPFVGATIAMKRLPGDAWEDALIAYAGPALGSAGAAVVAVSAHATQSQLLFALADFGFMINLFNLMPLGMMDGGRICGALSPYAGVVGLGIGGSLAMSGAISNPIFYLVLLAGGYETFQRFYNPGRLPPNYYRITPTQRAAITGGYFGLVAALFMAMSANGRYRKPPEVLQRERELHFDMM